MGKLVVVTGVSGSGKSSLAFDTIAAEARRQYLETIPSFARQYSGKINKPDIDDISGLYPVISIGQRRPGHSPKSTVGTISEIYDYLRLLFARYGETDKDIDLSRSLFSFNSPLGACPHCSGLGLEERISINKLVADHSLTLREGALVPTLPNGYIMYSQLTLDSLDTVCRKHGFSVDIPWQDLTEEQKKVILYGSTRIKVLKGKHTIESRLRWTALKAKPPEMGYYTGMVNIMEDILRRDRNRNILRFTESVICTHCKGKRLNDDALSVKYQGHTIDYLADLELNRLLEVFASLVLPGSAEKKIGDSISAQLETLCRLGAGHLQLSRKTDSLTSGELQRIRLVNQLSSGMTGVLYVFDEPSIGMHPRDTEELIVILRRLVTKGNTVIIVEHDPQIIKNSDWIIETGLGAGINGGEVLYNGPLKEFIGEHNKSLTPTRLALKEPLRISDRGVGSGLFDLPDCSSNNLNIHGVRFMQAAINVITGVPGAGKSSLVYGCLVPELKSVLRIDHSPIGRTPRSNPATYTGLADYIRDLFARQDKSKELGYSKGRFSFNNRGGRCEKCEGAGKIQIGMHYMGNIDIPCDKCKGKRFNEDTLKVKYNGCSISDIYDLSINQALQFFQSEKVIYRHLEVLQSLGLGYLSLGQSSTTLSGGEAQRIKLAAALSKKFEDDTWILLDEPTTGLHFTDTIVLIAALRKLADRGNTIVAIEYQEQFIKSADWLIDLGPGSGKAGGKLVFEGRPGDLIKCSDSITARYMDSSPHIKMEAPLNTDYIRIENCTTNNLKNIDISIPANKISVITGLSGSGKSSLAFDTIYSEAQSRFTQNLNTYARTFIRQANHARADHFANLRPAVAINRKNLPVSPRSTVGTITGIYEKYRFLFSRLAGVQGKSLSAREFSFNHDSGACGSCSGLGILLKADPQKLVDRWDMSVADGAFAHNTTIKYYGDPLSQFVAILKEAGKSYNIDINRPLDQYSNEQLDIVFNGTGDRIWSTEWHFKNKTASGTRQIKDVWKGFSRLIEEEYHRRLHNKNLDEIRGLLHEVLCPSCNGTRLSKSALSLSYKGLTIAGLAALSVDDTLLWFDERISENNSTGSLIVGSMYEYIKPLLLNLQKLGLGHISIDRRSSTLSGGEGQRVRLARMLSGSLTGMTFVLDEPTIGLHSSDVSRLLDVITELREKGNTIIIVEHDRNLIRWADNIIELGPGSGQDGGRIISQGSYSEFIKSDIAITPPYLLSDSKPRPVERKIDENAFGLKRVNKHNLVNRDFNFSSGGIIAITGVSGAGKSTLIHHVLAPTLKAGKPINCKSFYERSGFIEYVTVDQRTISGSLQSTVASYSGILDKLTDLFAGNEEARIKRKKRQAFSYNSRQGRCPICNGAGEIRISMDFMDDIWNTCDRCGGMRYNDEVLSVRLSGLNIAEVLRLTVDDAIDYCCKTESRHSAQLWDVLRQLQEIGLGHLVIGQSTKTLSGGEAQRLKMSKRLSENKGKRVLFMLDEPSSGLHYRDIDKLIPLFNKLVDDGHTVIFIEHNPYLISIANQVIQL